GHIFLNNFWRSRRHFVAKIFPAIDLPIISSIYNSIVRIQLNYNGFGNFKTIKSTCEINILKFKGNGFIWVCVDGIDHLCRRNGVATKRQFRIVVKIESGHNFIAIIASNENHGKKKETEEFVHLKILFSKNRRNMGLILAYP